MSTLIYESQLLTANVLNKGILETAAELAILRYINIKFNVFFKSTNKPIDGKA